MTTLYVHSISSPVVQWGWVNCYWLFSIELCQLMWSNQSLCEEVLCFLLNGLVFGKLGGWVPQFCSSLQTTGMLCSEYGSAETLGNLLGAQVLLTNPELWVCIVSEFRVIILSAVCRLYTWHSFAPKIITQQFHEFGKYSRDWTVTEQKAGELFCFYMNLRYLWCVRSMGIVKYCEVHCEAHLCYPVTWLD